MKVSTPKISVICPSFNHAKFIGEFITSLLNQSEQNFELLIIDDCSSDENVIEVRKFSDSRIRLIEHAFNKGVSAAINEGINQARSGIIALLASDDIARSDYLEKILTAFEEMADVSVVYVRLQRLDRDGNLQEHQPHLPVDLNRFELLRRSFFKVNQLPSPGMAIRKAAALGAQLPIGSIQYSDWIFHNHLMLRHEIHLLDEPLIFYRSTPGSISARSPAVVSREKLETTLLMDSFLEVTDVSLLERIFGEDLLPNEKPTMDTIPYILSRLAIRSPLWEKRNWGYVTLARFISQPGVQEMLHACYGFDYKEFMALTPVSDSVSPLPFSSPNPPSLPPPNRKEIRMLRNKIRRLNRALFVLILIMLATLLTYFFK